MADMIDDLPSAAASVSSTGPATAARFSGLAAAGGLIGAVASMSCCLLPLALFSVGVGGAWIGNLTALAPYQPYMVAITVASLATGFWLVYRRPRQACVGVGACGTAASRRGVKAALWLATALIIAAVVFSYTSAWLLGG